MESLLKNVHLRTEPTALRELHLGEVHVPLAALIETIRPVVSAEAGVGIPLLHPGEPRISDEPHERQLIELVAAGAIEKPDFRIERRSHADEARRVAPAGSRVVGASAEAVVVAIQPRRRGLGAPRVEGPRFTRAETRIQPVRPVAIERAVGGDPLYADDADARPCTKLACDAPDGV